MSYTRDIVRYTKTGIDMKSTGATTLFTTDNGTERFYPLYLILTCTAASSLTVALTASLGVTAASYNDILAATLMAGVTGANLMLRTSLGLAAITSIPANTAMTLNVTIAAIGTSGTMKATVFGYYE